ncbi:MAG: tripartite tricarboxylate transporter substrate-binding protein [Betaproteobacteria bacterium]|jgi:tripartite-type tricarboxylate transporter receptor subunit TctC|nr:tripartite tricarboxylate transporter substrate binding protein [Betaproteobacteria bacterium]NBT68256.1 tripartite tricarboxylate transporter substrate binding protein [Betaproteobacteria bacterium]NBY08193.1 tripartite tricarboxylate transporter substrate binding protein [Betaproteobacteria bacterium]
MKPNDLLRRRLSTALAMSPLCLGLTAQAQSTLPKTLTFLVPQNAGGSNDVMARAVAARLPALIGSNVVVENRTGAGGNVGSAYVAKSGVKDGSMWLVTVNSTQAINPALYKNTGFDPINDFEPVAAIALVQHAIVVSPKLPVNNLADLIALARREPGKYSYGSAGNGTFSHLLMEMLKKSQKINLTHVPYKGVAPAITDVISGNVSYLVSTVPACLQFIKSGQLKPLAVTSLHRAPALPDVVLANDTVPGLVGELWVAIYAPKGVPKEMIEQMRKAVATLQTQTDMEAFLTAQGATALKAGPTELLAMTREEIAKWGAVVRDSGMTVD